MGWVRQRGYGVPRPLVVLFRKGWGQCNPAGGAPASMLRLLSVFGLVAAVTACQNEVEEQKLSMSDKALFTVSTASVEVREWPLVYLSTGSVVAKNSLQLASRITGYIDHIEVDEGDWVEPGEVLVSIDATQVEAAIQRAEAALVSAQAELEDARGDLRRYRALSATQALAEDKIRDAVIRRTKAEAALTQAQVDLAAKRQALRYVQLSSPARAQVRERFSDQGDLARMGETILSLDMVDALEVEVYLPVSLLDRVKRGDRVEVVTPSAAQPIVTEVSAVVRAADRATHRSKVRIALPANHNLFPGVSVRARFVLGQEAVLTLPAAAVVARAGIEGLFVVEGGKTVRFRSVRTGRVWLAYREVLAGAEAGWAVVIDPPPALRDGDRVEGLVDGR